MSNTLPDNLDSFYSTIMHIALTSLKDNHFQDNFDAERFNTDGTDHSQDFDPNKRVFYFTWFFFNKESLFQSYMALSGEHSKLLYLCLIIYRMVGHLCFQLPLEFRARQDDLQSYYALAGTADSTYPLAGTIGKLKHFDFVFDGERYIADCLGFEYYLHRKQYFYDQDGIRIRPEQGDTVIDGGACTGDTALVFSNAVGAGGKVYSFDPVQEHFDILTYNTKQFPYANVVPMPYGLSDHEVRAPLLVNEHYAPGFSHEEQTVPLTSLDHLVARDEIKQIDFIKLDVEGAEMETLKGAEASIRRFRPQMAISLYHKPNDIFEIINYIKSNFDFYSLYIGHYTIHTEETVLYCAPTHRSIG
ncbi:FkbM family methyltransferase [Acetobacter syzygii]|uniref:FkbM family methyltransferase n=1 Tax=Acetobacter syzygii TaxID=146476 RepID=UPI0039EA78ED